MSSKCLVSTWAVVTKEGTRYFANKVPAKDYAKFHRTHEPIMIEVNNRDDLADLLNNGVKYRRAFPAFEKTS